MEEDVQQGQLLPDLAHPVQEILRGSFYTPELMVAGDIRAEEIRLVWGKVVRCEEKDCYSLVYDNKENRESVAPLLHKSSGRNKEEL